MKHLKGDDDFGHKDIWSLFGNVGQGTHADHQIGAADVGGPMVLQKFVEHLNSRRE